MPNFMQGFPLLERYNVHRSVTKDDAKEENPA